MASENISGCSRDHLRDSRRWGDYWQRGGMSWSVSKNIKVANSQDVLGLKGKLKQDKEVLQLDKAGE